MQMIETDSIFYKLDSKRPELMMISKIKISLVIHMDHRIEATRTETVKTTENQ